MHQASPTTQGVRYLRSLDALLLEDQRVDDWGVGRHGFTNAAFFAPLDDVERVRLGSLRSALARSAQYESPDEDWLSDDRCNSDNGGATAVCFASFRFRLGSHLELRCSPSIECGVCHHHAPQLTLIHQTSTRLRQRDR